MLPVHVVLVLMLVFVLASPSLSQLVLVWLIEAKRGESKPTYHVQGPPNIHLDTTQSTFPVLPLLQLLTDSTVQYWLACYARH